MDLNAAAFEKILASLPLERYAAGETILKTGLKTGRLLILKSGAVVILKDSVEIATVEQSGAVFGELSALLQQPHAADVLALEDSHFYVADAALLEKDALALLYVARILAARLVVADSGLVELKTQLQAGQPPSALRKTIEKLQETLKVGWDVGPWIA
jgi:CRP/FNR family transcriptional regulator, cyclic AMP receptor protein